MKLDTVAKILAAFYRLVGTDSSDTALTEHGENTDDVAYQYLTRGCRTAQRNMLKMGYKGWRQRSDALTWSGSDATRGGRYCALPSDFLRTFGNKRRSAIVEANGERWGEQIDVEDDERYGDYYYIRDDQLWITRNASPPTTAYLEYHYQHTAWASGITIDFPTDARCLIVAEAANVAKEEDWLPGGAEMETKIERALIRAREEARGVARQTTQPREFKRPRRLANRW